MLAGVGAGIWKTPIELKKIINRDKKFHPKIPKEKLTILLTAWENAVGQARHKY